MNKILVAGLVNVESTIKVTEFPIPYMPIEYPFYGINTEISGSGYNIAKAMSVLGDDVELIALLGRDTAGKASKYIMEKEEMGTKYVKTDLKETPQSTIFYDDKGKRQIYCDLKNVQEVEYDIELFKEALKDKEMVILGNSNFCRPFLKIAKKEGKIIATNVHALSDIYDEFNKEFMEYADILFIGDDNLSMPAYDFVKQVAKEYENEIIILGRGAKGAMLYVRKDQFVGEFSAVRTREIISTIGAGDALFSAFLHFYRKKQDPYYALKNGILFASYKIGTAGSSNGFMTEAQLEQYYPIIWR